MSAVEHDIRCMLIPMRKGRLLLPSSAVAEIIGYRRPDPLPQQPKWLLGTVSWHQRVIPVVDFERLVGGRETGAGIRQRIAVCYTIGTNPKWPLLGILAQGIPRLTRINQAAIQVASGEEAGARPVRMTMAISGENLVVPDLEHLQGLLAAA